MRRRIIKIVISTLLLAAGVITCVVRWQAWFGMPDEPVWTGDSLAYTFPTFRGDSVYGFVATPQGWQDTITPESLDILVLGDVHNRLNRADYDSLAARVPQIDAVAQVGDWLDRGQKYYYQLLLREWTAGALYGKPVINTPGNHEYTKGFHKTLLNEWHEWFPQPSDELAVPGVFYHIDFPQLRFIVMDTNPIDLLVYRTRVLTWLRGLMSTAGDRYVVVMMHHPVLSAGKGRFNPTIYTTFRYALGQTDLAIAGHDHSYMRRTPFVVVNAAGRSKPQRDSAHFEFASPEPVYSVLSVRRSPVSSSPLQFRTYRMSDGALIDSLYVDHH
ncbi:MAG: metallophosphoesterase [Paludibacteraceae bacterium]|nr:metallophosphoesterase [Paludibacteraceae bacterium]